MEDSIVITDKEKETNADLQEELKQLSIIKNMTNVHYAFKVRKSIYLFKIILFE